MIVRESASEQVGSVITWGIAIKKMISEHWSHREGWKWCDDKEHRKETTRAGSLRAVDLETSKCNVSKMGKRTPMLYRVILRYNFFRGLTVNQRLEEMPPILGDYCPCRPKLKIEDNDCRFFRKKRYFRKGGTEWAKDSNIPLVHTDLPPLSH